MRERTRVESEKKKLRKISTRREKVRLREEKRDDERAEERWVREGYTVEHKGIKEGEGRLKE